MINATNSALSGIKAFGTKIGVTANNVANVNTDGFKKSRAVLEEGHPSGVTVSIEEIDTPGAILPAQDGSGETRETSNVALEEEVVNLITTRTAFSANIETLKTWDEMTESLIDLFA
jgi:flagellar basal-body rod protein FlgC